MSTPTNSSPRSTSDVPSDLQPLHAQLTTQAVTLLSEVDAFATFIAKHKSSLPFLQPEQILNRLRNDVQREINLLNHHGEVLGFEVRSEQQQLKADEGQRDSLSVRRSANRINRTIPDIELAGHRIRSSNVAFLYALWTTVKQLTGVIAIKKQVRFVTERASNGIDDTKSACKNVRERSKLAGAGSFQTPRGGARNEKEPVVVDIICNGGRTWVKLFTKSMEWLGMDLAKQGLVDVHEDDGITDEDLDGLKLVKMARDFLAAAKTARVDHRHPEVVFHLPRIQRGVSEDIDMMLEHVGNMGIKLFTANDLNVDETAQNGDRDLTVVFNDMIKPVVKAPITDVLNLDCTILIALISDISHIRSSDIKIPAHYNGRPSAKDILGQLKIEPNDPLLPNHIYPLLSGKRLVCTKEAASHLRNILQQMGSITEMERSQIFFPTGQVNGHSGNGLPQKLRDISIHNVPANLQLPIEIVDFNSGTSDDSLRDMVMRKLSKHARLSPLNESVFFHGWSSEITTLTLNRVVAEWLDRAIDGVLDEFEFVQKDAGDDIAVKHNFQGPKMFVCGRERSLLGNDKV